MLTKNMLKNEVDEVLSDKGDFVKIDYLNKYLNLTPPIEMRKFAYLKLAEIYENRRMFDDAAKSYRIAGMNSIIFREKIKYFVLEAKTYIKKLNFAGADKAIKRALSEATLEQRKEIVEEIKSFYREIAGELEKNLKRNQASQIYEKLLKLNISDEEKEEIKEKLKALYEKLGKVREIKFLESD